MKSESKNADSSKNHIALPNGVYDVDYYVGRQNKRQLIYRLRRRTDEVEAALSQYLIGQLRTIVDIGTADGLMLDELRRRLGSLVFLGMDLSFSLLGANPRSSTLKIQADALQIPIKNGSADAVIATAVIEHVPDPMLMLHECARLLRPDGLLVLTTPVPWVDRLADLTGIWKDAGHQETFNLRQLRAYAERCGFTVVKAKKFMFSPIGFPLEKQIERIFGPLGLSLVMANQLMVARRG